MHFIVQQMGFDCISLVWSTYLNNIHSVLIYHVTSRKLTRKAFFPTTTSFFVDRRVYYDI